MHEHTRGNYKIARASRLHALTAGQDTHTHTHTHRLLVGEERESLKKPHACARASERDRDFIVCEIFGVRARRAKTVRVGASAKESERARTGGTERGAKRSKHWR